MNFITSQLIKRGILSEGMGFDYIKNTGLITLSKLFEVMLSYGLILLISRYLGAEGLGQYAFLFSFASLFFIFGEFGTTSLMVKEVSKKKTSDSYMSKVLSIKFVLSLLVFIIYFLSLFFIEKNTLFIALVIVGIYKMISSLFVFSLGVLRIQGNGKIVALATFAERSVAFIIGLVVLYVTKNITLFVLVLLFSKSVQLLIGYKYSSVYFKSISLPDWGFVKSYLKKSFPFLLIGLSAFIYVQIDIVMLTFMKGFEIVGWYESAYKLINIIALIPGLFLVFGFPIFSKLLATDKKRAKFLLEMILKAMFILIIPIMAGVFFLGSRIMEFVYSFNSVEAFTALKILIFSTFFIFMTGILGNFIAAEKQEVFAKIAGLGALINILLNIILIPYFSLYGAAIATLCTYILMFILMFIYVQRKLLRFSFIKYLFFPLIGVFIMLLVLKLMFSFHVILIVVACVLVYGLLELMLHLVFPRSGL